MHLLRNTQILERLLIRGNYAGIWLDTDALLVKSVDGIFSFFRPLMNSSFLWDSFQQSCTLLEEGNLKKETKG